MSAPQRPVDKVTPVSPPPADVPLIKRIAEILLAAYALDQTLDMLAALLAPYKVSRAAIGAALSLANRRAHVGRPILTALGIPARSNAAKVSRRAAHSDVYFRAGYVAAASGRIQRLLSAGKTLNEAKSAELPNFEAHVAARQRRIEAAGKTALAAELHGPLLGWYRNPLLDSDTDCIAADGNNFYAEQSTIIGWPGAVHPHCGCSAGPPHLDGGMVDDVLGTVLGRLAPSKAPREVLKLRGRSA